VLCDGEGAGTALGRKRKGRGRQTISVEVKIRLTSPLRYIDPWSHAPRNAHPTCINCRRMAQPLTGGTHHDRGNRAHARAIITVRQLKSRGGPSRPPAHVAHYARGRGAKLWPRLWALNGPVPYQVRTTLERPEHEAQKIPTIEGCDYRPVASKPAQRERAPQVPSIFKNY
jgi:hypothetical protein